MKSPGSGTSRNCKRKDAKPSRCKLKREDKGVGERDTKVDEKLRDGSQEVQNLEAENCDSKNCSEGVSPVLEMPSLVENDMEERVNLQSKFQERNLEDRDEGKEASENSEKLKFSGFKNLYPKAEGSSGDAQHTEDKENEIEAKENASASDNNRGINHPNSGRFGGKVLGRLEASKSTRTATRTPNKTLKEEVLKYRRPKPTNPKPFRLRTDERGILKEANMERRFQAVAPHENAMASTTPNANSQRKQGNEHSHTKRVVRTDALKGAVQQNAGTLTPQTPVEKACVKPNCQSNDASKRPEDNTKKTKWTPSTAKLARPTGAAAANVKKRFLP